MRRSSSSIPVVERPTWILNPPSGATPPPPVRTRQQILPLGTLSWSDFEKLCLRLSRIDGDPEHWQLYGTPGQAQGGIDIYVRQARSDRYVVWQSKRHRKISAANVRSAVRTFLTGSWVEKADRFVLCTSASLADTDVAEAVEMAAAELRGRGIVFDPRDDAKLSETLKGLPELVDDFFDRPWVQAFCGREAAEALGARLGGREFGGVRERLAELYRAHFASVDPGVLRAAGVSQRMQAPLPLSARFIPPDLVVCGDDSAEGWITTPPVPPRPRHHEGNADADDAADMWEDAAPGATIRRESRRISLTTWSQDLDRAVIVGPPGAGKSTLLRFIALDAFDDYPKLPGLRDRFSGCLPVWISFPFWTRHIKRHAAGTAISVNGIVTAWFEAHGELALAKLVARAMDDRRVLLLVDGVDEWIDETAAATAVMLLNTFIETRKLPVAVTSRPHGARLLAGLDSSWRHYELAPLTVPQQVDFTSAWFEHLLPTPTNSPVDRIRARRRAEMLIAEIHRTPQIAPLAEVPLMLGGLLALSMSGANMPRNRFRAYQELCARLLESHPRTRGQAALSVDQPEDLDPSTRERVLAGLAFEVQAHPSSDTGLDAIRIPAAQAFCRDFLVTELDLPNREANQLAQKLINASEEALGVLVRKSPEEIGFLHRAFQEFLAAKHIAGFQLDAQCELMRTRAADPRWRDVLLFVVQSASRPTDVEQLVEAIETARPSEAGRDWSITLLLADIAFGDVRRTLNTTRRLAESFFALVETGPDWSERIEILRRVVAGLSNEQTAVLIRPKLKTWFPSWHGHNLNDALRLMADWGPDPRVDEVLWRSLQNDLDACRLTAAESLAKRCGGKDDWFRRLAGILQTPPSSRIAAAALRAIVVGWPEDPRTMQFANACCASDDQVVALAGIQARIEFGVRLEEDRDRLTDWLIGDDWRQSEGVIAPLVRGWPGDNRLKAKLLRYGRRNRFGQEAILKTAAKAFPQDDEVAAMFAQLLSQDDGAFLASNLWDVLAESFRCHPTIAAAVDVAVEKMAGQTYELANAAAVAPTEKIRCAILATMRKPEHLIFWSVHALIGEWGSGDVEVAAALATIPGWKTEIFSDVADRVPEIVADKATAKDLLMRTLLAAKENRRIRADKVLAGLHKLGVTETAPEIVDHVLGLDLLSDHFTSGMTAVALIRAYPRDPRVIAFARRQLRQAQGLVSVIALMMGDDPTIREEILSVAGPLPQRLREAVVPMLQDRAVEDAFSRELLMEGQAEAEAQVISASAISVARTRIARGDVDDSYLEHLRSELRSVGPRLGGRRLGAFAAAALVGHIDLVEVSEGEREFYIGDSWSVRENRSAYAALAECWDSVTAKLPIDRLFALLRLNDQTFIDRLGAYVDRAPQIGPALAAALARSVAAGCASGGALRYLASQRPRSQVLREQCLRLLMGEGRSWSEAEPQLVAAELLARHFGGDPEVLQQLAKILSADLYSGATAALCDGWPEFRYPRGSFPRYRVWQAQPTWT